MNRDSNIYTFLFVGIMVIGIASILAFTSQTLKPMQKENVKNEKVRKNKLPDIFEDLKKTLLGKN